MLYLGKSELSMMFVTMKWTMIHVRMFTVHRLVYLHVSDRGREKGAWDTSALDLSDLI